MAPGKYKPMSYSKGYTTITNMCVPYFGGREPPPSKDSVREGSAFTPILCNVKSCTKSITAFKLERDII